MGFSEFLDDPFDLMYAGVALCGLAVVLNFHPRNVLKIAPSLTVALLFLSNAERFSSWLSVFAPELDIIYWRVIFVVVGAVVGKTLYEYMMAAVLMAVIGFMSKNVPIARPIVAILGGIIGWFAQSAVGYVYNQFRWAFDPMVGGVLLALGFERFFRSAGVATGPACGGTSMACGPRTNPAVFFPFLAATVVGWFLRYMVWANEDGGGGGPGGGGGGGGGGGPGGGGGGGKGKSPAKSPAKRARSKSPTPVKRAQKASTNTTSANQLAKNHKKGELQAMCEERNLSKTGTKTALAARIWAHDKAQ